MYEDRTKKRTAAWLLTIGVIMLVGGLTVLWFQLPSADETGSANPTLVASGCKLMQTIDYARCGHQVLRRIDAPAMWAGMTKESVAAAMEQGWRMTGFSAQQIDMACALDMFCPEHWVLLLADGAPGVYRNRYGFEMERLSDATVKVRDEATWEALARGMAFETRAALDAWVEAQRVADAAQ